MTHFADFESAARRIAPRVAVVLGSGLGTVVDHLTTHAAIAFADIPGFVPPTVPGHDGRVLAVEWGGAPVLVFRGRMHFYEGHPWDRCVGTVRLAAALGVKALLLTNAAGGIRDDLHPGDLMTIRDHLPLLDPEAWRRIANGPPEPTPYSLRVLARLALPSGVYAGLTGPTYETPAEIRALRAMGADAVGMSTVREAIVASELGLEVAAISCITNKAAGLTPAKLDHLDVQEIASRGDVVARLAKVVEEFCTAS
jgi:purine-nucleoside phosphorylase